MAVKGLNDGAPKEEIFNNALAPVTQLIEQFNQTVLKLIINIDELGLYSVGANRKHSHGALEA